MVVMTKRVLARRAGLRKVLGVDDFERRHEGGGGGGRDGVGSPTKQGDPSTGGGVRTRGARRRDQPGPNGVRGEVIARLAGELAKLARAGDVEGARCIHEAIARLLS